MQAARKTAGTTSQLKKIGAQIALATQRAKDHQERIEGCQRLQKEIQDAHQVFAVIIGETIGTAPQENYPNSFFTTA